MATYGGGSIIFETAFEATPTISSGGGVIGSGQVFFTAPVVGITSWQLISVANVSGITGNATINCRLQRLGATYANYVQIADFSISIFSVGGFSESQNVVISDVSPLQSVGRIILGPTTSSANPLIRMYPGERFIVSGGTCTGGTNWRLGYQRIRDYNSQ